MLVHLLCTPSPKNELLVPGPARQVLAIKLLYLCRGRDYQANDRRELAEKLRQWCVLPWACTGARGTAADCVRGRPAAIATVTARRLRRAVEGWPQTVQGGRRVAATPLSQRRALTRPPHRTLKRDDVLSLGPLLDIGLDEAKGAERCGAARLTSPAAESLPLDRWPFEYSPGAMAWERWVAAQAAVSARCDALIVLSSWKQSPSAVRPLGRAACGAAAARGAHTARGFVCAYISGWPLCHLAPSSPALLQGASMLQDMMRLQERHKKGGDKVRCTGPRRNPGAWPY